MLNNIPKYGYTPKNSVDYMIYMLLKENELQCSNRLG